MIGRVVRIWLVLMLSLGVLAACTDEDGAEVGENELNSAPRTQNISVDDIQRNPDVYFGQQATVTGYIVDILGPDVALMASDQAQVDGPYLLVLNSVPEVEFNTNEELGDRITANGEIRRFVREDLPEEYVINMTSEQAEALEGIPMIEAYAIINPGDAESGSDVTRTPAEETPEAEERE